MAHYLRFHPGSGVPCRVSGTQDLAQCREVAVMLLERFARDYPVFFEDLLETAE